MAYDENFDDDEVEEEELDYPRDDECGLLDSIKQEECETVRYIIFDEREREPDEQDIQENEDEYLQNVRPRKRKRFNHKNVK